jgi:pyrroline-5-carboxylate reductase
MDSRASTKYIMTNITLIGCGKLGSAIAGGLLNNKKQDISLTICEMNTALLNKQWTSKLESSIPLSIKGADIIILCVKPSQAMAVIDEMKTFITSHQSLCSTVMGLDIKTLREACIDAKDIIRVMPNIAAAIGQSANWLCFELRADQQIIDLWERLGSVNIIDESLMNASTVLTGSGIAFALQFLRAMQRGGIAVGFDAATSLQLSSQVISSAITLLQQTSAHPEQLIDQVTTPGGCTIKALRVFEEKGFDSAVMEGIVAGVEVIGKR